MKSILIVSSEFPPGPGGIGSHAYNLYSYLKAQSLIKVSLITEYRPGMGNPVAETEVTYLDRSFLQLRFVWLVFWHSFDKDLVIASGYKSLIAAIPVRWKGGKVLAVLHGHELPMSKGLTRRLLIWALKSYHCLVAVSEFSKGTAARWLTGTTIHMIPNGIQIRSEKVTVRNRPSDQTLKLLTIGTVSPRKGQHNVVTALPAVLKTFNSVRYLIAGQLRNTTLVMNQIARLGLEGTVCLFGFVPDEMKRELINDAGIFVMLSENLPNGDLEGFGIAILEANQAGLPAIGSRGCGIEQAIKDGFNGRIVDPHNSEEFLTAVCEIMENYEYYSRSAIDWARRHSWELIGKEYEDRITEIAEGRR